MKITRWYLKARIFQQLALFSSLTDLISPELLRASIFSFVDIYFNMFMFVLEAT